MAASAPDSSEAGFKDRFFDYFKQETAALQEQIDNLSKLPSTGKERVDAINHSLAAIAKLQRAVSDASSQLPAHNQKSYSDQIKQLNERLQKARESIAPRQKFSFKNARKSTPAPPSAPTTEERRQPSATQPPPTIPVTGSEKIEEDEGNYNLALRTSKSRSIRSPSFSKTKNITLQSQDDIHIILPSSASPAITTATIRNIKHSIIDLSFPWTNHEFKETSFATMNITNMIDSLIQTGSVKGATHITNLKNSTIVASTGQLRMHQCENVDVYLHCSSAPIIEHCNNVRFAPIPEIYQQDTPTTSPPNHWNKVQDFQWIKAEHSPHWSEIPLSERVSDDIWKHVVSGSEGTGIDEILKSVGVGGKV